MNIPEIRIQFSRLLDPFFKTLFEHGQHGSVTASKTYPTTQEINIKILEFKDAWEKRNAVLGFVQQELSLDFYQSVINVYVVGDLKHPISAPILLSSLKPPDEFVDSLTHELLHRLISDNSQKISAKEALFKLFPNESLLCRNHIIVHAALKKVYLEFMREPKRLMDNVVRDKHAPDYVRAWEIVEKEGADALIARFKKAVII